MSSRSSRRENVRTEALLKLAMFGLLLVSLAVGGVTGLPFVFISLVFLLALLAVVGGGCFLILRSRLILTKKAGLSMILVGGFTLLMWRSLKAPEYWLPFTATVRSVKTPPCTVETDFEYQVANAFYRTTRSKHWNSVEEARRGATGPVTLFYNANDPRQTDDKPRTGMVRVSAKPVATRLREEGNYEAALAYGTNLFDARAATLTDGMASSVKAGDHVPLWVDPIGRKEISLTERKTEGGRRWDLLGLGSVLIVGGIVGLFVRRGWLAPTPAMPMAAVVTPRPLRADEQLEKIDWYQFEKTTERLLTLQGWRVERRGGARPDGGADLLATREGQRAVVQCKAWRNIMIAPSVVRELLGTKTSAGFRADVAMLFSLSDCSPDAKTFADENGIVVRSRRDLVRAIEDFGIERFPELLRPDDKRCPKCESPMVLRQTAKPFWGCSTFPACRGKIEATA